MLVKYAPVYRIDYPDHSYTEVRHTGEWITYIHYDSHNGDLDLMSIKKNEAIDAAMAILKCFNVDFNAYEENISERYRAPTDEEMAKFLAENPNYRLIPKEAYEPDGPLTSELKWGAA